MDGVGDFPPLFALRAETEAEPNDTAIHLSEPEIVIPVL